MKLLNIEKFFSKKYCCYSCGEQIHSFLPYKKGELSRSLFIRELDMIGSDVENFSCPICYCHDRERHLLMYFDVLELWKNIENSRVLHISPELAISKRILNIKTKEYIQGDLNPTLSDIDKVDICSLKYEDGYFDFIICNHVLEHVIDDIQAMTELKRVLSDNGKAILQTPYSNFLSKTFRDKSIDTDELRLKYYGQEDHVRVFGRDFFTKLKRVGFILKIKKHSELLEKFDSTYYGVNEFERLILVEK